MLYISVEHIYGPDERELRAAVEEALGRESGEWHVRVIGEPETGAWEIQAQSSDFVRVYDLIPVVGRDARRVESLLRQWAAQRNAPLLVDTPLGASNW